MSFAIAEGETLGLVGESGCGKSTTGKAILRLRRADRGRRSTGAGSASISSSPRAMRPYPARAAGGVPGSRIRRSTRACARPTSSPSRSATSRPPRRREIRERVAALFDKVGLRADQMVKYPYEFSGGQRQRLGIARALAPRPRLIVCDEPVSALDVSVQAQVINLLMDLQDEFGLSYLFVAHDLAVVEHISHRVAVMYLGKIVELADKRVALHAARSIPTPRRCSRRCRCPTRARSASASSSRATCRARSIRRRAAASTRAARMRSSAAASRSRS